MDLQVKGRRALVTGSTSGLGEATARLLAKEGAEVVIHGRDPGRARKIADSIIKDGGSASIAVGDLATDAGADRVAQEALAGGLVDILVNNAGAYEHLNWADATPEIWVQTYEVNVISGVRMIQRLVPAMRERGWGRVVTIGGGLASQPFGSHPHYNASLAARHNLAVSLARDLAGTGVTSNVVSPGAILVPAVQDFLVKLSPGRGWGDTWEEIELNSVREIVPNDRDRYGRAEEIAGAVAYLCGHHADYISGATVRVDGGSVKSAF
ncbi:SDR family NAD(P)-dependent oxidoreductase [Asanoa sp. WMMD1127]|uniref:SDR family NAD(P)-dependent oxidoreductase n=1 Tax=Asanoa sp. WMMD1127 TaxID=3016107 RepID=UPI002416FB65|nr:SDR family oxidoreductase [Asanoa sp. WMMD1127]MDG4826580.1 SDR family NAD(P)-dependent oxidoreductase [Asanoa sp. WMMD1127]